MTPLMLRPHRPSLPPYLPPSLAGYLNLAMIILGVHFSHAVVDCVSLVWRYGVQVRKGGREGGRERGKAPESFVYDR